MKANHLYNLMTQLTEEAKSVWRIEKHYIDESDSEEERIIWKNILAEKENHIRELKELVRKELSK